MEPAPLPVLGARASGQLSLAKLPDRFVAYLVDTVPFGVGYYASLIFFVARWKTLPNQPATFAKLFWAWLGLYLIYHAVGNALGATAGKRLFSLKVVDREGNRLAPAKAVLRALGLLASTPLVNLGFLWALFQRESRTWHDLLAGSIVVETRRKSVGEALAGFAAAVAFLAVIAGADVWYYLARPTPSDLAAIKRARQGLLILAQVEERCKADNGVYSRSLADLAVASGDVAQFKEGLRSLFDPRGLRIKADREHYLLSARALDRKRTAVVLSGPPGYREKSQ